MNMKGLRVLVTGASRGIGRAIVTRLAAEGADLIITARNADELDEVAREIARFGGRCLPIPADLRRTESILALSERSLSEFGGIDVLVNNAGVGAWGRLEELTLEQYEAMFDLNVRAVFLLTREIVPSMVQNGGGTVVNIGSTSGRRAYPEGSLYCASKFAVSGMSEALAKELQPSGVRVCTISPGSVNTYLGGSGPSDWQPDLLAPEDIAESVLHAVSMPKQVFVTEIVLWPRGEEIS